ncbi:hypothetical protein CEN49_15095 [Fischerella thermalis CCMEE 5273]|nr:hypothetical protein CEN49_15095 [Fischerella thermalis CCMEE 5273]
MWMEWLSKWSMRFLLFGIYTLIFFEINLPYSLYIAMYALFVLCLYHLYQFGKSSEMLFYFFISSVFVVFSLLPEWDFLYYASPVIWIVLLYLFMKIDSVDEVEPEALSFDLHDLHRKTFRRSLIGYQISEVNHFLNQISNHYKESKRQQGEKLTHLLAHEIHSKTFKRSLFGFNIDEVNDFLDQVAIDIEKQSHVGRR